jgi:hypothetical protein
MLPLWGMGWAGGASSPPWGRYSFNMRNFEKQTQRPLTKPGISNVPYNTGHIKQKQKTTQLRHVAQFGSPCRRVDPLFSGSSISQLDLMPATNFGLGADCKLSLPIPSY